MSISKVQVMQVVNSKGFAVAVASAVSATAGYYFAREQLKSEMARIIDDEIAETKAYYAMLNKDGEFSDPATLAEKYDDDEVAVNKDDDVMAYAASKLLEYEAHTTDYKSVSAALIAPFTEKPDHIKELNALNQMYEAEGLNGTPFDLEEELKTRDVNEPYIISFEEWLADDAQCEQISITYYEEDDILADEGDRPIPDVLNHVGDRCLSMFGYGSKDPAVVYVRNENKGLEFEILLNKNSFESEVLGIQHSRGRGLPRFRGGDDE